MIPQHIVARLAASLSERITRRVIRALQGMSHDCLAFGEDTILETFWDDVCAQCQLDPWLTWDAYDETARLLVSLEVERLRPWELAAIWHQTPEGEEWDPEEDEEPFASPEAVVDYLVERHVYAAAGAWSNARIREYRDRSILD